MKNSDIKILFFGSTEFSLVSLSLLHELDFDIVGVVTQPDKPMGRGKIIQDSPIKKWSISNDIKVLQPTKLKEPSDFSFVSELSPDIFVVVSYGKILPLELISLPKFGAVNVHASLLPKYRGASPIQSSILAGDSETGITIMLMNEGMDTGPILKQETIKIDATDTAKSLSIKLGELGATLLAQTLPDWINNTLKPIDQQNELATICKKISKEDGKIDWHSSSLEIERLVRAYNPWPSAWCQLTDNAQIIKIKSAQSISIEHSQDVIGQIFLTTQNNPAVYCENYSALELLSVQPQGKQTMSGHDFILGHKKLLGTVLK